MEELKHKVDDLAIIDRGIVEQLNAFAGTVNNFQSSVLTLSSNVSVLTNEVKYLRRDIDETRTIKSEINEIQKTLASNKGGWTMAAAIGAAVISIAGIIIEAMNVLGRRQ